MRKLLSEAPPLPSFDVPMGVLLVKSYKGKKMQEARRLLHLLLI